MTEKPPLLEVKNLCTQFATSHGMLRAVDDVSFTLLHREAVGVVGESGSGKSVTALSILGLFGPLDHVAAKGEVLFEGVDLLKLPETELRQIRGAQIAMVFQDPLTSLNPLITVGEQVAETLRYHRRLERAGARRRAQELMELVGIGDPVRRFDDLPEQFSGGMRQRIMIAIAIACEPKLLIADEPTTALDVTVQSQVLALLNRLRKELGMALMMISHDLGVIAATCDSAQVMYGGRLVERGKITDVLERPAHPYTAALLQLVPRLDGPVQRRLKPIPGQPMPVFGPRAGCRFAARCEFALARCHAEDPPAVIIGSHHTSACWLAQERPAFAEGGTRVETRYQG
jgi:peptide/nickel transport system ATP-binding protein/oligopeptide transport system ATP-binding protein